MSISSPPQVQVAVVVAALAASLWFLAPILSPFVIALLIAYISNPGVSRLEQFGIPRWISMLTGIILIALLMSVLSFLLLPALKQQSLMFFDSLPVYIERFLNWIEPLAEKIYPGFNSNSEVAAVGQTMSELAKETLPVSGEAAAKTVDIVKSSATLALKTLTHLFLTPVIAFYLLRDWNNIGEQLNSLLPHGSRESVLKLARKVDEVLKSFLFGQLLVMICLGLMYSIGLLLIGTEYSLLIGVVSGVLSFVPFLGTAVGLFIASVVMIMQADQWLAVWKVFAVFSVGQFIEGNFLTPKLVGDQIDLHPVVVIFAVMAGGQLFGFIGVLLALPVAAVIWVITKETVSNSSSS